MGGDNPMKNVVIIHNDIMANCGWRSYDSWRVVTRYNLQTTNGERANQTQKMLLALKCVGQKWGTSWPPNVGFNSHRSQPTWVGYKDNGSWVTDSQLLMQLIELIEVFINIWRGLHLLALSQYSMCQWTYSSAHSATSQKLRKKKGHTLQSQLYTILSPDHKEHMKQGMHMGMHMEQINYDYEQQQQQKWAHFELLIKKIPLTIHVPFAIWDNWNMPLLKMAPFYFNG